MTSWIQITCMSTLTGGEAALVAGLEPTRPRSTELDPNAWMTSPPEANWIHSMDAFGMHASSQPRSLTTRSPLGIGWNAMRTEVSISSSTSTGHSAPPASPEALPLSPPAGSGASACPAPHPARARARAAAPPASVIRVLRVMVLLREGAGSGLAVPGDEYAAQPLDEGVQRDGGQADDDDAGDGQGGLELLAGHVRQAADAGDAGVELGGDDGGPGEAGGDPDAADDLRQRRRQH